MDLASIQGQIALGIKPDYALFWAGVWNEKSGWDYLGRWADQAADQGVAPVVEWFYWGNDISPSCVQDGCWSTVHDAWKNKSNWNRDAYKLADALHNALQGRPGVLVIESEFNKNGISTWETFDAILASHAAIFRSRAPELKLALGFGNWGSGDWARFDRAVAAVDMVGLQSLRGSTRDSATKYLDVIDTLQAGSAKLKSTFGKAVLLHDIALSTYTEPTWSGHQESVVKELFQRLGELRSAGVTGIVYRTLSDNPDANLKEFYGQGERYWGLRHSDGSWKPALDDWVSGVKAARGSSSTGFSATFDPRSEINNYWVEVKVTSKSTISKVEARVNGGTWIALALTDAGTWGKGLEAQDGDQVQFRATDKAGNRVVSGLWQWGQWTYAATFDPLSENNNWWVEVKVTSSQHTTSKVEARVQQDSWGSWITLPRTDWGTWAKSFNVPDGAQVQFRATDSEGAVALSMFTAWG
ncbi:MAG TPA: hypothetical protein VGR28_00920 [Candidatus Thermoplasmatota archaeon]|jgi:hypothetical protein|nr:hypothetical protein [Candidatus Thermoplasmatota archaeon]